MTTQGMFLARRLGVALMALGFLAAMAGLAAGTSPVAALWLLGAGALTLTPTLD